MHSRAHTESDPIYRAMHALRTEKQGGQVTAGCTTCHNPRAVAGPDSPAGRAGVSCAACHNVDAVHRDSELMGAAALQAAPGRMLRSARDLPPGASTVHDTGSALPAMQDGNTLCLACHNATRNPAGAPACTTGPEHAQHAGGTTCMDCHMPRRPGAGTVNSPRETHASHQFPGPHRAWYQDDPTLLEEAVELQGTLHAGGLRVRLINRSAHGFPSGFPGRMAVLTAIAFDASGRELWRNHGGNPAKQDPQALLNKVYHDDDGKRAPAAFATTLFRDNRLQPDETRELRYTVPSGVSRVALQLDFRLMPRGLARTLGLAAASEAEPRTIARHTVTATPARAATDNTAEYLQ